MPNVALIFTGAGIAAALYAGFRWLAREFEKHAAEAERLRDGMRGAAAAARSPRDLGPLVWDDTAGVYRPGRPA